MVTAQRSSGTSSYSVFLDGVYQQSSPSNVFYWQTDGVANGPHKLEVIGYDRNGKKRGSTTASVVVANGSAVSLPSPSNGSTVSGTVTISIATASNVSWANIYVNGVYQNSTPPHTFYWHTNGLTAGQYVVSATAFDRSGYNLGSAQSTVTVNNSGGGGGGGSSAVSISSPSNGATVSGSVNVAASIGSGVEWVNFYVDGGYLSSSPPADFSWTSGSVSNGAHTLSARAYNSSGAEIGSASTAVNVQNTSITPTAHFSTLPPGSTLPSGSACTSAVRRNPNFEPRPENYTANHTVPTDDLTLMRTTTQNGGAPAHAFDRVDGNFTGTTDEIIQWASCKWGFEEDLTRATAADESWWRQSAAGDPTANFNLCPSGAVYNNGKCSLTYGIVQVKSTDFLGTFPDTHTSTAFDLDYKLAYMRACFEGQIGYLSRRSSDYPSGNQDDMLWGCIDEWYSGTWWNGSDDAYLTELRGEYNNKPWLQPGF